MELPAEGKAIAVGQRHIEEHCGRLNRFRKFQGLMAGCRKDYRMGDVS